jgi:two-component system OmpR family response regulator
MMLRPILVVEDDRKIANVIKVYLQEAGYRVLQTDSGKEAVEITLRERPAAVLLDLMLPDMSGEEVCQELKEIDDIPVIMVTSKYSEEERVAGFALGADDYVVKPFSPRELVYRVKAVLKRVEKSDLQEGRLLSFNSGGLVIDGERYEVLVGGAQVKITSTEFKVLHTLASQPGRVFTRDELVEKALGYQFEGYERSIDAHVKNIRRKIEPDTRNPMYIQTVYGVGYRFAGKQDA